MNPKYKEVFEWIGFFILTNGYPPTIREIMEGTNYHSTSAIVYVLNVLENEGYISREHGKQRTIVIREAL